ncbi:intradiol ring-cleavage dioxygenase [Novosphingobium naphthalenivorans]|uniref:intradiol ring-cleavage dioxygenase n=1 Tax=Novosphingobium naphthalenivorans TaxID=273168 RepID=UPI000B23FD9B|nr:intradiol ring-cleavage dioxygenase [Novosphingobium naphthalenivorans]
MVDSTETNGPYPADGTNTSSGSTSNVLTQSGVVRSDIRSSFINLTTTTEGVQLDLELQLVDVNTGCAPIEGAAIYIWHCNASGLYSLYSSGVTTQSWLRGVQVTDSDGKVTFTTIYPGCYSGRWPHIHFEVFADGLGTSSTGRTASLISQLAMPAATNTAVYTGDTRYTSSISPYNSVSLASDNIFSDNTAAQMAQQTPTISGSLSAGYTGSALIGIAV